jgi:hypothetical protein
MTAKHSSADRQNAGFISIKRDFQESVTIREWLLGESIEKEITSSKAGVQPTVHGEEQASHGSREVWGERSNDF